MTPSQIARLEAIPEIGPMPDLQYHGGVKRLRNVLLRMKEICAWYEKCIEHESSRADKETVRAGQAVQGIKDLRDSLIEIEPAISFYIRREAQAVLDRIEKENT